MTENPMGTDGFEFVEFAAPHSEQLTTVFEKLGFELVGRHRSKRVAQYRQGDINFILNAEPKSPAEAFAATHGPSACAMAFRVTDAKAAYERALAKGAKPFAGRPAPMELNIPRSRVSAAPRFILSTVTVATRSTTWISSLLEKELSQESASPASTT